tara:strand:- start:601 stop:1002 length:402 start_codon:yes stop_codon:yes gene_type:complete
VDLPKVNILTAGTMIVAIVGTISGGIWYASSQASVIEGLSAEVERLTIENNATDRTNLIRDVEANSEQIDEIIDYIVEVEEDGGETIDEIYEEIDALHEETASMAQHMMAIIKLQARVAVLEKTMQFTKNDGM